MARDNFGYPLSNEQNGSLQEEISTMCSELYIPSIEAGYISPCLASIAPAKESVSPVFPKTGIILAAAGAGLVTAAIFLGLVYRKMNREQTINNNSTSDVEDAVEGL